MQDGEIIEVVGLASHSYLPGALVTFASILKSTSRKDRIRFHIFSEDFTVEDKESVNEVGRRYGAKYPIVVHKPNIDIIKRYCEPYKGSYLIWVRLFLCKFLDFDWVVYVDTDTLWYKDIADLWEMRDDNVPIYWSLDLEIARNSQLKEKMTWCPGFNPEKYGSGGVLLMNLAYLRKDHVVDRLRTFIDQHGCPFYADQDIMNLLYNKEAVVLDPNWDCMVPNRRAVRGTVLHCVGVGRMFRGPMVGWDAFNGMWYDFYYKEVLGRKDRPYSVIKKIWWKIYGLLYPNMPLLKLLTLPCASHRAAQLMCLQFRAWVCAHAKWA